MQRGMNAANTNIQTEDHNMITLTRKHNLIMGTELVIETDEMITLEHVAELMEDNPDCDFVTVEYNKLEV
jgi:hypothetical protein